VYVCVYACECVKENARVGGGLRWRSVVPSYALQHTQRTATHCNTLQHTATHWIVVPSSKKKCSPVLQEKESKGESNGGDIILRCNA